MNSSSSIDSGVQAAVAGVPRTSSSELDEDDLSSEDYEEGEYAFIPIEKRTMDLQSHGRKNLLSRVGSMAFGLEN